MSASCPSEKKLGRLPSVARDEEEADAGHARSRSTSSIKSGASGSNSLTAHTNAIAKKAGLAFLFIVLLRQWALVLAVVPFLAPPTDDVAEPPGGSSTGPGSGGEERDGAHDAFLSGADPGNEEGVRHRPPRIVTVLTTYGKRAAFIKPYKEAVSDRSDGYHPEVGVVGTVAKLTCKDGMCSFALREPVWVALASGCGMAANTVCDNHARR